MFEYFGKQDVAAQEVDAQTLHAFVDLVIEQRTGPCKDFAQSEIEAVDVGREFGRLFLQKRVNEAGAGDVGEAVAPADQSEVLSHRRYSTRKQDTTLGEIEIPRTTYSFPGEETIIPRDEKLNLPADQKSYPLLFELVNQALRGPYAEARDTVASLSGAHVAKRTIEKAIKEAAVDFEAFYSLREADPPTEKGLIIGGVDRKGVPLTLTEEQKLEIKRKKVEKAKATKRRSKGRPPGKKMATVTVAYSIDPFPRAPEQVMKGARKEPDESLPSPPRPHNKRVWASLQASLDEQVKQMVDELIQRDPSGVKVCAVLMDGEKALRHSVRRELGSHRSDYLEILDFVKVSEYLWKAVHVLHAESSQEAEDWVSDRLQRILHGEVRGVIQGLRQIVTKRQLKGKAKKALLSAAKYFEDKVDMMRYDEYLTLGLPIASGPVEGACKNLVGDRFERSGMRWIVEGAEPMLKMRSIERSSDLEDYWQFHMEMESLRNYGRSWEALLTFNRRSAQSVVAKSAIPS